MSATDYLNNAQEWLAQQSQRTIDYQWEIQHHNQMHKAYETSWQVFLDLSNFQQQYNGQEKTICLIYTNRPHKGRLVVFYPAFTPYTLHLTPLAFNPHSAVMCTAVVRRVSLPFTCQRQCFDADAVRQMHKRYEQRVSKSQKSSVEH